MRKNSLFSGLFVALLSSAALVACMPATTDPLAGEGDDSGSDALKGPGADATDARKPELNGNPSIVRNSKIAIGDAIAQVASSTGPVIEAKFEIGDDGNLSLSIYPVKDMSLDSERNVFQEFAGDPTVAPYAGTVDVFSDREHLLRSSRDLTLVQLSSIGVADAAASLPGGDTPYWSIPTIRHGRAGYGVYYLTPKGQDRYRFVDGEGDEATGWDVDDLGTGPGDGASDARTPELGNDLSILTSSKISMKKALIQAEKKYGQAIEAKFELGDDGKLSLSIYPVKDMSLDAERNTFVELAGDPTVSPFKGDVSTFDVPDFEHLTRSARDLTLVQTAGLTLRQAVETAEWWIPGGFVYWAIPTIRDTRSGFGVYVREADGTTHYLFIS